MFTAPHNDELRLTAMPFGGMEVGSGPAFGILVAARALGHLLWRNDTSDGVIVLVPVGAVAMHPDCRSVQSTVHAM